jgi:hypothetical protein
MENEETEKRMSISNNFYLAIIDTDSVYQHIEEIPESHLIRNLVQIELFTLNELIKLYPSFKRRGEYIYFNDDLYFNYKNYRLFENNPAFGGSGNIEAYVIISKNQDYTLTENGELKFCKFLKYPFEDIYINSGIYIMNWMIKSIKIMTKFRVRDNKIIHGTRRHSSGDLLISKTVKHFYDEEVIDVLEPRIIETPEGFSINIKE